MTEDVQPSSYDDWSDDDLARREERLIDSVRALELPLPSTRAALPDGATITIASPCPESWHTMVGDDRERHCSRCDKSVYNLGEMSADDVTRLFMRNAAPCVRFFRRADGAVMTSDCQVGRPKRVMLRVLAAVAVAVGAVGLAEGLESRRFHGRIDGSTSTGTAPMDR